MTYSPGVVPKPAQLALAKEGKAILKKHAIVYFACEERTGKSLAAMLVTEEVAVQNILIITKKGKPIDGWLDLLANFEHHKAYTVINYHSAHKVKGTFDLIILDESHNYISSYPKTSKLWREMKKICWGLPIIYISATPHAQGKQMLYHQFALSKWSPWHNYSNFYNWFRTYGIEQKLKLRERTVNQYTKVDEKLVDSCVSHLFITKTRKELGFKHEPKDKLHYIELGDTLKEFYNTIVKTKVGKCGNVKVLCDTTIKFRSTLHMLEGGGFKTTAYNNTEDPIDCAELVHIDIERIEGLPIRHNYYLMPDTSKIDYILDNWGDTANIAIMYNYKTDGIVLRRHFNHAQILQASTHAEGIDLAHVEHLIVFSQNFSTAQHTQRRARQAAEHRDSDIIVHFLLVKNGISEQVYDTVAINKLNYVDSLFERKKI